LQLELQALDDRYAGHQTSLEQQCLLQLGKALQLKAQDDHLPGFERRITAKYFSKDSNFENLSRT
jgi:hypothetical protein